MRRTWWTKLGFIFSLLVLQDQISANAGADVQANNTGIIAHGVCGDDKFQCKGNSTMCIHRYLLCNGNEDCDNGADEWQNECFDYHGGWVVDKLFPDKEDDDDDDDDDDDEDDEDGEQTRYKIPCVPGTFPSVCDCTTLCSSNTSECDFWATTFGVLLHCQEKGLTVMPDNIPGNSLTLDISDNRLTALRRNDLNNLTQLVNLYLSRNDIQNVEDNVFDSLIHLEILNMESIRLEHLPTGIFRNLSSLMHLDLSHNQLTTLRDGGLQGLINLKHLDLADNRIHELKIGHLVDLMSLKQMYLSRNKLTSMENGIFQSLDNLETLHMVACDISTIPNGLFTGLHKLATLDLSHNKLTTIESEHLFGLNSLVYLNLGHNGLSSIEPHAFQNTPLVSMLHLENNRLTNITQAMIEPLRLMTLILVQNHISFIERGTFVNQDRLYELSISDNLLDAIRTGMFSNLSELVRLNLRNNSIHKLELGSMDSLISLEQLDLRENPFVEFPTELFNELAKSGVLERIYFDHFYLCGYAPHVRHCHPRSDGISSTDNLLANALLRSAVWIVAILAFVGNLCVLLARCFLHEDNKIHSFFITNLAVADLLMGLYLVIIGAHDTLFRGEYIEHDIMWRSSLMCNLCGFLSFLSSEMSVMTLSVITLDRFICIVHPFKFKNRFLGHAAILMVCLWVFWIVLGALPVVHTAYFGNFYYGANGVCLPLQINYPYAPGWEFSLIIFVIFNLIAFMLIVYAYLKMFLTIRWSSLAMRSTKKNQDWPLVKRFGLIVLTDFLCWMPIIIIKFIAFGGISVSNGAYAWFAIFVLPVNSALNPILYTMTTKMFKQKILVPLGILKPKRTRPYDPASSVDDSMMSKTSGTRLSVISSKSRAGSVHANKACPQLKSNNLTSTSSELVTDVTQIEHIEDELSLLACR